MSDKIDKKPAKLWTFFISVPPGLESQSYLELCQKEQVDSYPDILSAKGGLEIQMPFALGCELNLKIRTSSRILLRWKTFPSPHIRDFKQEMSRLAWTNFYPADSAIDLQWSSRSSKLSFKKQIIETLSPILKNRNLRLEKGGRKLFIRLFRDECQVSIDTTGERAQFRGGNKQVGQASLRENIAAALLGALFKDLDLSSISLVDPMTGSGTFLLEALQLSHELKREFEFQSFPIYRRLPPPEKPAPLASIRHGLGIEIHGPTADIANLNLGTLDGFPWEIRHGDSTTMDVSAEEQGQLMIINPPWGKRLGDLEDPHWFEKILQAWKPQRVGLLWPMKALPSHKGYNVTSKMEFDNSGIKNQFLVLAPVSSS